MKLPHTHERKYSKGNELPRQTVPRAPGAESPALRVTLATESALLVVLLLLTIICQTHASALLAGLWWQAIHVHFFVSAPDAAKCGPTGLLLHVVYVVSSRDVQGTFSSS